MAAAILAGVLEGGQSLDRALEAKRLTGQTKAAVQDLSYGVLRAYGVLNTVLSSLLNRPLTDMDLKYLLLVGLHELVEARTPAYAAVHETVQCAPQRARGLVNAILRNFQRRQAALLAAAQADPVARWNHPAWWIARLQAQYPDAWPAILTAANGHPPMTLRVNLQQGPVAGYLEALRAVGLDATEIGEAALCLARPVPVAELPGFAAGRVSVQDLGAQFAAGLLDCVDGMRVLDACAAPGGKTGHLLERHRLSLTALDSDARRLQRVEENLHRLGLKAQLVAADAAQPASWWDGQPFDRILLDAPCTASGVVRRHPDGKWLKRVGDATVLAGQQQEILEALWPLLRRGGKLLYATCSLFHEENRGQVVSFLERHPDAQEESLSIPGAQDGQLLPDDYHDGFFYARLVKT